MVDVTCCGINPGKNYVRSPGLRSRPRTGRRLHPCVLRRSRAGASLALIARPHLTIDFVREQLRRLNPGKDGIKDHLFALPRLGKL